MRGFPHLLQKHREQVGLSQSALGRMVGVNASYVSRLEAGERQPPRREILLAICKALRLSLIDKNELLLSAGYAPVAIEDLMQEHPTMGLLASILEDREIPESEKEFIRQYLKQIQARYRPSD